VGEIYLKTSMRQHHITERCEAAKAKATLLALAMNIVNRGFDPTMN
jgi:hypothetical protein